MKAFTATAFSWANRASLATPLGPGKVAGQDSAFAVPYRDKLFWFWGDTSRISYPLGHFWMAGAVSELTGRGGLDPAQGVDFTYFTDTNGFSRPMCRLGVERGPIWADGFMTVPDAAGRERLVCHYAHMESLHKMIGHGLALYDDAKEEFEKVESLDLKELWRFPPQAHPVRHPDNGLDYFYLGEVFPTVRVSAQLEAVLDHKRYEAWTCLEPDDDPSALRVRRNPQGALDYAWRADVRPVDPEIEQKLLAAGAIRPEEARYSPVYVESGERIRLHRGSVNWNNYRNCWTYGSEAIGKYGPSNTVPDSSIAPIANSGWPSARSLRTSTTSRSPPSASAMRPAIGTAPRGTPSTRGC